MHGNWLTPPNLHAYEFSWAPKSSQITFVAAPPPGENNWWVAKLYVQVSSSTGPTYPGRDRLEDTLEAMPQVILRPCVPPPSPRPPDRRPPLLARRQADRLHRRPHVRPGLHRRRYLSHVRHTAASAKTSPPTRCLAGMVSLARRQLPRILRARWWRAVTSPRSTQNRARTSLAINLTLPESIIAGAGRHERLDLARPATSP